MTFQERDSFLYLLMVFFLCFFIFIINNIFIEVKAASNNSTKIEQLQSKKELYQFIDNNSYKYKDVCKKAYQFKIPLKEINEKIDRNNICNDYYLSQNFTFEK